jgi:hypothetical protein
MMISLHRHTKPVPLTTTPTIPGALHNSARALLLATLLIGSLLCVGIGITAVAPKAQAQPVTQWQHAYGGSSTDLGYSVTPTLDGNYLVTGATKSATVTGYQGGWDVYLAKVSPTGTLLWQHAYGGAGNDYGFSALDTGDGYLVAGVTYSFEIPGYQSGSNAYLAKISPDGTLLWQHAYGGTGYAVLASMHPC